MRGKEWLQPYWINEVKAFVENLKYLNPAVFDDDAKLTKELVRMPKMNAKDPEKIGPFLISPIECCVLCGFKLSVRQDRCAHAIIYDDYNNRTLPALHFNRYYRKKAAHYSSTMAIIHKETAVQ